MSNTKNEIIEQAAELIYQAINLFENNKKEFDKEELDQFIVCLKLDLEDFKRTQWDNSTEEDIEEDARYSAIEDREDEIRKYGR